jgi:hypothetical protein
MTDLENYIYTELEQFNTEEPPDGHYERFKEKLAFKNSKRVRLTFLKIAAIVLIGFIISYAAFREFDIINYNMENLYIVNTNVELYEAEQFYNDQLALNYKKLQQLGFNNDMVEKNQILNELSEMDHQVQTLKNDLKLNPDDERVVHAIIYFYQVKLELMDVIISRLQQPSMAKL